MTCLLPSGCITDELIEAAATIKDDSGVEYDLPVPKGKDPIRQFKVGDNVQFRLEKHNKKQLTLQQAQNRPLVLYPDTSQNVETYLFLVLPNGKEHKYDMGLSNPNDKPQTPGIGGSSMAGIAAGANANYDKAMKMIREVQAHQALTMSDSLLQQMCGMDSGDHNYYQPYCDELKKRDQAAKAK